jgi:twinkle protein
MNSQHELWLRSRGIAQATAEKFGLRSVEASWNGRHRHGIAIPYRVDAREVTTKVRWLDGGEPKWTHDRGGKHLWNEDSVSDSRNSHLPIVITEGEWDALAALQSGISRCVSVPCGAASKLDLPDRVLQSFRASKRITLCGDADDAGQQLNAELSRRFGAARCVRVVYPPDCKDLNDVLRLYGEGCVTEVIRTAEPYPIKGLYSLSQYAPVERPKMYTTGFKSLDPHFKMWPGEFCVITGVPSHGKSQFALELLCSMNRHHQHKAVVATFEMSVVPFVRDIIREHYWDKRRWQLNDEENAKADVWIEECFRFIDEDPRDPSQATTLEFIVERAEDAVFRHGVEWLLIDPWNQVEHRRERFENELDYQLRAIRALKRFARSYRCGVLVVAHPTKSIVNADGSIRRPSLYDISGSAHWANAADHGVVIWRDDLASTQMTVSVVKSRYREAGLPGIARLARPGGRLGDAPPLTSLTTCGVSDSGDQFATGAN